MRYLYLRLFWTLVFSQFLFLHFLHSQQPVFFSASTDISDAYIMLDWSIADTCINWDSGEPVYLQISDASEDKIIYSELISFPTGISETVEGQYVYWVGPNQEKNFRLELFAYGPGNTLCPPPASASGRTLPFQPPLLTATDSLWPDRVELTIARDTASTLPEFSHLGSYLLIYRNEQLIAAIDSSQFQGQDTFLFEDIYAFFFFFIMANGASYTYCVKVQNIRFNDTYGEVCDSGSTWPLNLSAAPTDQTVTLSWRNLTPLQGTFDSWMIERDGDILSTSTDFTATSFTDLQPTFGKIHTYELVLTDNEEDLVATPVTAGVPPNGQIAGRVTTQNGSYGLPGVMILLETTVDDQNYRDSVWSDQTGYYHFDSLYYGEEADFKLTAALSGQSFALNPRQVQLARGQNEALGVNFRAAQPFVTTGQPLPALNTLALSADTLANRVHLDWTYRKGTADTVFVQVVRNGQLLDLWMDSSSDTLVEYSYADVTGNPGRAANYTVRVYRFLSPDSLAVAQRTASIAYPEVYPVTGFGALSQNQTGTVRLNWQYQATHISGFYIYRDDVLIATLPPEDRTYIDLDGVPGVEHRYSIRAFAIRSGTPFASIPDTDETTYPALPTPTGLQAEPVTGQDHLRLQWEQPTLDHPDYNFDDYLLFRREGETIEQLAVIDKGSPKSFRDFTGVPGTDYTYGVAAYATFRLGAPRASDTTFLATVYPAVTSPQAFAATLDTTTRSVQLAWEHVSGYADGFRVYRDPGTDPIAVLSGSTNSYTDYLDHAQDTITYHLEAFVIRAGETFASERVTDAVGIEGLAVGNLDLPTQFRASTTYPDRVQLSWEYLPYLLPEFSIYRDDSLLATLDAFQRSFADTTAEAGKSYTYALMAQLDDRSSARVYSTGAVRSLKRLTGRVATADGAFGVGDAFIQVIDSLKNEVHNFTVTDAAGYFRFDDLPFTEGVVYLVRAEAINHALQDSVQSITLHTEEDNYQVNFVSTKILPAAPGDEVAEPLGIAALVDDLNTRVAINWSVNSPHYSGFEVYRSLNLLGTITKGDPLSWTDTGGIPAIDYSYRIRTYWDREDGSRVFSDYASVPVSFPALAPVENLKALPNRNYDRVELSWSHPTDRVDHYLIVREGESTMTATVAAGTAMAYHDTLGLPGQLYRYSVYAVQEVNGEEARSLPVTIRNVPYPGVAPVRNLQVQSLVNGIQLDWTRTDKDIEGYYVYRDDEQIADLPQGSYTYRDYGGIPNATHVYAVAAYYTAADGEIYTSDLRRQEQPYPHLTAPDNLALQDSAGGKLLSWQYPYTDGYDGFELFLSTDTIELVVVSDEALRYFDDGGLPGGIYDYGVRVFKKVAGGRYYSDSYSFGVNEAVISGSIPGVQVAIAGDWAAVAQAGHEADNKGVFLYQKQAAGNWTMVDTLLGRIDHGGAYPKGVLAMSENYLLTAYNLNMPTDVHGLNATYFNDRDLQEEELTRIDTTINFSTEINKFDFNPRQEYPFLSNKDNYTARWEGFLWPDISGDYTLYTVSDDEIRMWIDEELVIDAWGVDDPSRNNYTVYLSKDQYYPIKIEYVERTGESTIQLSWTGPGIQEQIIPSKNLFAGSFAGNVVLYKREGDQWLVENQFVDSSYHFFGGDLNETGEILVRRLGRNQTLVSLNDVGGPVLFEEKIESYALNNAGLAPAPQFSLSEEGRTAPETSRSLGGAMSDRFAAAIFEDDDAYEIRIAEKVEGTWQEAIDVLPPNAYTGYFGQSLVIGNGYLFISDQEKVYYRKHLEAEGAWSGWLTLEDLPDDAHIQSMAITDSLLAVGMPEGGTRQQGIIQVFRLENDTWAKMTEISPDPEDQARGFGQGIALDGGQLLVGAMDAENNAKAYFFDLNLELTFPGLPAPDSLQASDGTYENYVDLQWTYTSDLNDGFIVYRDEVAIDTIRRAGARRYQDLVPVEQSDSVFHYYVKAYQENQGQYFESAPSNVDTGAVGAEVLVESLEIPFTGGDFRGSQVTISGDWAAISEEDVNETFIYERTIRGEWIYNDQILDNGYTAKNILFNTPIFYRPFALDEELLFSYGYSDNSLNVHKRIVENWDIQASTDYNIPSVEFFTGDLNADNNFIIFRVLERLAVPDFRVMIISKINPETGDFSLETGFEDKSNTKYFDVAITDEFAAGVTLASGNTPQITYFQLTRNEWSDARQITDLPEGYSDLFGLSLALQGDYMAVGDPGWNDEGAIFIYRYDRINEEWTYQQRLQAQSRHLLPTNRFGWSVALDDNLVTVGAPDREGNDNNGAVFLFRREGDSWQEIRTITPASFNPGFGTDLDLDNRNLVVGAYKDESFYTGNFVGTAYFYDLSSVTASDGEYAGYTRVRWDFPRSPLVESFNIYRSTPGDPASGNEPIASVPGYTTQYSDMEAVPGRRYIYQVTAVDGDGKESPRFSDVGWRQANGRIKGQVVSQSSLSGVPGITVTATGMVDGERQQRSMVTGPSGEFNFQNLPFGDGTTYEVKAFASGHAFVEDVKLAELTPELPTVQLDYFLDKTAFTLEGKLHPLFSECGIEGVKVTLKTFLQDQQPEMDSVFTNEEGAFSFNIDKYRADLDSIRLSIGAYSLVEGMDTVFHQFSVTDTTFARAEILDFANPNVLDVTDELTYRIPLQVANTCGDPLGPWTFTVEVKSRDGCFRQLYKTDTTGRVLAELPPMDYLISVRDVSPVRQANIPVIEYLKYRPEAFDLAAMHRGEMGRWTVEQRQQEEIPVQIIYHRKPQINLISGLNRYLCDDRTNPAVLVQNNEANLRFSVLESTNTSTCTVGEGFLIIKNGASASPAADTIRYDSTADDFPVYTFTVGDPQTITPYVHNLIVEYHTESDGYLTEWIQSIIVEGVKSVPGSDVIVNGLGGKDGEGLIKYPLMVLRDPPGDQSYSYIKSGTTLESTFSINREEEEFDGVRQNFQVSFVGVGVKEEFQQRWGDSDVENNEFKIRTEISEEIRTDEASIVSTDGEYVVGPKADVIAGVGMANQYGLGQEVRVNDDGCGVSVSTKLLLSGMSIQTQWIYTVNHIENTLLPELEEQRAGLQTGAFEIAGMDQDEADDYLSALMDNWRGVLNYYRLKTLPHYCLCDPATWPEWTNKFPDKTVLLNSKESGEYLFWGYMQGKYGEEKWRRDFCEKIGRYSGKTSTDTYNDTSTFTLNDEIVWTENLIDEFNQLSDIRRRVQELYTIMEKDPDFFFGQRLSIKEETLLSFLQTPTPLFGTDFENITFSGNTSFSKEVISQQSQFTEITNRDILDRDLFAGGFFDGELSFEAGLFVTVSKKVFDLKEELGYVYNYREETAISEATAIDSTVTTGYVLSDDDDGDQYSVTAIRGISPNHTPYFELVGGRSTCPPFEGTILRDRPQLSLEWPDGEGVNNVQYNVPADGAATFPLAIKNENPFNEPRWFYVNIDPSSNPRGAWVFLDGLLLSEELYRVPANEPLHTTLQVERGPGNFYQYEDLRLIIRPFCSDVRASTAMDRDTIHFSAFFEHPCSDVSIIQPGNNWVIKKGNPPFTDSREQLILRLADYDLNNEQLDSLRIQYRRIGTAVSGLDEGWITETVLTRDSLQAYYEEFALVYTQPQYVYTWDITGRPEILDGDYEIRVVADCGPEGTIISNVIRGRVDRSQVELLGFPQPDDGFLHRQDLIRVAFSETLDCARAKQQFVISLKEQDTGKDVPFTCICSGDAIELKVSNTYRDSLDGKIVVARVDTVYDQAGNTLSEPIVWSFRVIQSPLHWEPYQLEFDVYEDESQDFAATLHNSLSPLAFELSTRSTWLERLTPASDYFIYETKDISFRINTEGLAIGQYRDTVHAYPDPPIVTGLLNPYQPDLIITLNVIGRPPAWDVNSADYEDQMVVQANYRFKDSALPSTDPTDFISVWIDGEIRGVGNIEAIGNNPHATLIVYGDATHDQGKPLEFRVWRAREGKEYNAHPAREVTFAANGSFGSSRTPETLLVNRATDLVRYIPLNKGWTWFSLNTDRNGNPLNETLRSLQPSDGDLIYTKGRLASYLESSEEWIAAGGLEYLQVTDGFAIHLQDRADTLRVTGAAVDAASVELKTGWHFLGFPRQEPLELSENIFATPPDSATILTTRSALDNNVGVVSEYQRDAGWLSEFELDRKSTRLNSSHYS